MRPVVEHFGFSIGKEKTLCTQNSKIITDVLKGCASVPAYVLDFRHHSQFLVISKSLVRRGFLLPLGCTVYRGENFGLPFISLLVDSTPLSEDVWIGQLLEMGWRESSAVSLSELVTLLPLKICPGSCILVYFFGRV